jgi:hypothetical protein
MDELCVMMWNTSALLSAFLSKPKRNSADLTGHLPCPLECLALACAVLPTPPQKRRNGTACLCAITSSKNLLALASSKFLIAWAASLVFYLEDYIHTYKRRGNKKHALLLSTYLCKHAFGDETESEFYDIIYR